MGIRTHALWRRQSSSPHTPRRDGLRPQLLRPRARCSRLGSLYPGAVGNAPTRRREGERHRRPARRAEPSISRSPSSSSSSGRTMTWHGAMEDSSVAASTSAFGTGGAYTCDGAAPLLLCSALPRQHPRPCLDAEHRGMHHWTPNE